MTNDTQTITDLSKAISAGSRRSHLSSRSYISAGSITANAIEEAILAEFLPIPRADLPEVVEYEDRMFGLTAKIDGTHFRMDRADLVQRKKDALKYLALAEYLEARESEAAAAEAKRDQRRDELAREMCAKGDGIDATVTAYRHASNPLQAAIDRIIDLEAQVQA